MTDLTKEFDDATSASIEDHDIEAQRELVGVDLAINTREYVTTATPDAIRSFARGLGDDNPLFGTEGYGRRTRWGGQIAPSIMAGIVNSPLAGDPLDPGLKERTRGLFSGIHVFVSGGSWEWFRPIHAGDRLYSFGGIESLEVKESSFAGRSVIRVRRFVKMNQRGEVVAVQRIVAILTERRTAKEKGKYADVEAAHYTDADLAEIDAVYAAERRRGGDTRWFEDVAVGDELGPMAKGPLVQTEIICFHAGGYGFTPYAPSASRLGYQNRQRIPAFYVKNEQGVPDVAQRVHWDSAWAQAIGNPMAYDYGYMRECWLHHLLTDWAGDEGWIVSQQDSIRRFNYVGDTQILTGRVTATREEQGRHLVDVEVRATNQRDEETVTGTATIALPSRSAGAVALPNPPTALERGAAAMLRRHGELRAYADDY